MTFKSLTAEQEKLLFSVLDYRDSGQMASDAFTVFDMSTFGGSRLMLSSGGTSVELVDCGIPDLLPLSEAGYIALQLVREAAHSGEVTRPLGMVRCCSMAEANSSTCR